MIVLQSVDKAYGAQNVLSGVSFRIDPKEFVCITGPSGAGKSTLIALMIGAETPTGGSVEVDGVDLRAVPSRVLQIFRRRVGVAYQDYKLLPSMTVWENIAFPLEVCGAERSVIRRRVPQVLEWLGLSHRSRAFPHELSGGEKARASIGRAVIHDPMILFVDEPTGNLDPLQASGIARLLQAVHRDGTTVVLATHETALVDALQTRVIRIDRGRIIHDSKAVSSPVSAESMPPSEAGDAPLSASVAASQGQGKRVRIMSAGKE